MEGGRERAHRELEASLVLTGPGSEGVVGVLADLDELAGRRLGPPEAVRLRDLYLDLPGEPLLREGRAFRLRRGDGDPIVGLKGPGRRAEGAGLEREEREAPWGPPAVEVLRRALAGHEGAEGRRERLAAAARAGEPPLPALRAAGFHVLQDRETRRIRREILEGGGRAGELAVDEVRFDTGGRRCVHREVEVEAATAGPAGRRLLGEAVAELERRFGDGLRRWEPSKLATGLALTELLSDGARPGWLAPDGSVGPEGYERVEALLEETGGGG